MRFALRISSLISGRQMHRMNACIFLVAITKKIVTKLLCNDLFSNFTINLPTHKSAFLFSPIQDKDL